MREVRLSWLVVMDTHISPGQSPRSGTRPHADTGTDVIRSGTGSDTAIGNEAGYDSESDSCKGTDLVLTLILAHWM